MGEAFGSTPPDQDPDQDGRNLRFDLRFPGQKFDIGSKLFYNYHRDYEPETGRYIQSDPIGLRGGVATYAYSGSSPLTAIDPLGLLVWRFESVQWIGGFVPGMPTTSYPGANQGAFNQDTCARTTLDWSITARCVCGPGGFILDEIEAIFSPIVLMKSRFESPATRRATRRDEMDHVNDLDDWVSSERQTGERIEAEMKRRSFATESECKIASEEALDASLKSTVEAAFRASKAKWDISLKHSAPSC